MANEHTEPAVGRTILAVDDEVDLLEAVRRVLSRRGHLVLTAIGATEAVELYRQHGGNIDLLLTDVQMPGCTGTDLANQLSELHPGLSVLFMSGLYEAYSDAGTRAQVVAKPFTPTSLADAVENALSASAER
jgi:DNA-binding NtrC family response regulator